MLDADLLKHPVIPNGVAALVDGRGGLVVYGQGLGGRETLVAAAAGIAAATGKTLTIVDAELLRKTTAALITHLGVAEHTFLSPEQGASWPTRFPPGGVLAVHGDVLRNQDLVQPLRAAARDASLQGHLVVARYPYGSRRLDAYASQFRQITAADFMTQSQEENSTGPDTPGPVARRVQSPSWQTQQIREPTWIPPKADHQAERLAQGADRGGRAVQRTFSRRPQRRGAGAWTVLPHGMEATARNAACRTRCRPCLRPAGPRRDLLGHAGGIGSAPERLGRLGSQAAVPRRPLRCRARRHGTAAATPTALAAPQRGTPGRGRPSCSRYHAARWR